MTKKVDAHALNFFVPGMTNDVAESYLAGVLVDLKKAGLASSLDARFFSLAHTHNGEDFYVEVGKPDPYDSSATVHAILGGKSYIVITTKRIDTMIGSEDTFGVIPFADFKGTPSLNYKHNRK
jgi:hypothetical protein